jgi:Kef-type K+ transport system membrane component KefB
MAFLAMLGKVVGCGAGALSLGRRSALIVGIGMVPRGEVTLIVANTGRALGVIPDGIFSAIIVVVVLTTLIVPPCLAAFYRTRSAADACPSDACPSSAP